MKVPSFISLTVFSSITCLTHTAAAHSDFGSRADAHAPIGVMGDHLHKKGEFMLSFRYMNMSMAGNLKGSDDISSEQIATTEANRFAGMPGMPPTLRIVPQEMTTTMSMLGMMYAPTDKITLMAMLNYVQKDMQLRTFQGGTGTNVLGDFNTEPSGLGDTKLAALISAFHSQQHKLHFNVGLSLPTGSIDEQSQVLAPNNMRPELRLPYAMQLGSGTYDIEPGLTYTGYSSAASWGAQYMSVLRMSDNDEGYTLGDKHQLSAWGQYLFNPSFSASLRWIYRSIGDIDGIDPLIRGPVQTADPRNYGGDFMDIAIGVNLLGHSGSLTKHRVAAEYVIPLTQDVNGVQMEMENMLTLGYQYPF